MGVLLNFDEATVANYQAPKIEFPILALPSAAAAGELARTAFLVCGHQLCAVYTTRGQGRRKWERRTLLS